MKRTLGLFVIGLVLGFAIFYRPALSTLPLRVQAVLSPRTAPALDDVNVNATALPSPLQAPRIVVAKAKRQIYLYDGDKLLRNYPVGLGFQPEGDKEREGDGRTPEGDFYVSLKNANSRYYLSLGLSYPGNDDARRGLEANLISRAEHDRIVAAIARQATPPWNTALGGEIMIHGHGSKSDWTLGCVALENEHIKELFHAVPVGTSVKITP